MKRPLISVTIPAYNLPAYTRKTLQSIVEQNYRPIEVLFSDDCSPTALKPLVEEFRGFENDDLSIKFFRQPKNLRHDNMSFLFDQCTGKYFVNMQHDDWWTDKNFLTEAVKLMEGHQDCHMCVANSEIEGTNGRTMMNVSSNPDAKDRWRVLEGDAYIKLFGSDQIGIQARSAIVLDLSAARSFGIFRYPYNVEESLAKKLAIMGDDGFSFQFLLSSIGCVAITDKVVGVRGMPETSYSKALGWDKFVGQALFIVYYNLYKADLKGKHAYASKRRAKEMLFDYPVEKFNWKILQHYHYAPDAIWLTSMSHLLYRFRLPVYYVRCVRRLAYRLRHDHAAQVWSDLRSKFKARGVFRSLFPDCKT